MAWDDHFFCTCRLCGKSENRHEKVVKYGVRHYAHHNCYLAAGKSLSDLHKWQLEQFPWRVLKAHNLMTEAEALLASKRF